MKITHQVDNYDPAVFVVNDTYHIMIYTEWNMKTLWQEVI